MPPPESSTLAWGGGEADPRPRDLTGVTLGDFRVERLLGRGGMGDVYLARQVSLNRPVALKVLRPDLLSKPAYLKRFEAEAWAVAKLNHPNIVQIHTLGEVDGVRFIAMEYVQGTNLRDFILKKRPIDLPLALSIMKQAGVAVGVAGEIGLIHRDIKPENILLTRKGQVKVADFGLCRDQDSDGSHVTQPGVTMGTPLYMSPEQAQGQALDHRSDLYSLGVTFYQMVAGVPPFEAQTALAVALKHVKDTPVSPKVRRPDIPDALERLILKLMAKKASDRYQSAAEMLRDLGQIRLEGRDGGGTALAELEETHVTPPPRKVVRKEAGSRLNFRAASAFVRGGLGRGPGRRAGAILLALGLTAGLALGWMARPVDLLADSAPSPGGPPALWMAPSWKGVERQPTAEAQYRYAQLRVSGDEPEAAWLAVPGNFRGHRPWTTQAYIQLARLYLRRHDIPRLKALEAELRRWKGSTTAEKDLAEVIRTAIELYEKEDLEGVLKTFSPTGQLSVMYDPAILELSIEIIGHAVEASSTTEVIRPTMQKLKETQDQLVSQLFKIENPVPGPRGRPR